MATPTTSESSHIGRTVSIKGEVSGNEDIYVDGQMEGRVQLSGNSLTVGPNGRVQANIVAKNVAVSGALDGNIQASERTEMRKSAVVNGDVQTRRIAIEEGAYFKGRLEILAGNAQLPAGTAAVAASAAASRPSPPSAELKK